MVSRRECTGQRTTGCLIRMAHRWLLGRNGHLLVGVIFIGVVVILLNFLNSTELLGKPGSPVDPQNMGHSLGAGQIVRKAMPLDPAEIRHQERIAVFSRIFQKQAARKGRQSSQACIHPHLDLKHDTNQFAYHDMPPINCTGHSLFFIRNGAVVFNKTIIDPEKIGKCSYYGVERVSDEVASYTKPIVKESPPFDVELDHDFIRITCILKTTLEEKEKVEKEEENALKAYLGNAGVAGQDYDDEEESMRAKRNMLDYTNQDNLLDGGAPSDKDADNADGNTSHEADGGETDQADDYERDRNSFYYDFWGRGAFDDDDFFNPDFEERDYDQFLVQVQPKTDVFKRVPKVKHRIGKSPMKLNVLMFGLDSMSHLCFQRKMPLTYSFLKEDLEAAILHSYNIVGDATTAALIPMFTGRTEMELPEVRQSEVDAGYVDEYPLVWKLFKEQGYVTLYAEDEPTIGTFNLRFNGFHEQPTDHYMRHFWQALWNSDLRKNSQRYCTGDVPHHKFMLKYVEDFFMRYRNVSRFAFAFHGELTHWDNNPADYVDADLRDMLRRLQHKGMLDNTVVVIMGDHGARYSKVRYTVQGKLEERLPMMSFAFPEKFRKSYPHLWRNLKANTVRLSTPFDIYETLLDILNLSRTKVPHNPNARGLSLLREIPVNRTCQQAGIGLHWCGCLHQVAVDVNEKFVKPSAAELVSHINLLTTPHREYCAELKLKTVNSAFLVMPNEQVLKYLRSKDSDQRIANFSKAADPDVVHYQLQIETEPCGGLFEATVMADFRQEEYKYTITPGISRINMYGDQPKCIQAKHPNMRKFCCCHSYLNSTGQS